jgi:hypothetical protein
MNPLGLFFEALFFLLVVFAWAWFFRADIARWQRERGPRRKLALEAAREREAELTRMRDELAAKYLQNGPGNPPAAGG